MRRWFEQLEQFAIEVILEDRKGKRASALRSLLYSLSHLYLGIVQLRLWLYRKRYMRERTLGCLVISIGNLTVGGTGKTPVVEKFARALQAGGRRVAILSRGYKSKKLPLLKRLWRGLTNREPYAPRIVSDGRSILLDSRMAGDEPYMLAVNLKDVIVLVDKNRVASGLYAVEEMGCDTLLLDDGMQFLRLKHRLEIVLIDRQAPFGNEYLLPRGTLREPAANLRRASYIFITKSMPQGNEELIKRIRKYNRTAEIIECAHQPQHLEHVLTGERLPLEWLRGKHVGALSAIAAPKSFEDVLKRLGAKVELTRQFADHHRFTEREITGFLKRCGNRALDAVITTEKDYVRLPRIPSPEVPIYFLRVEIEILSGADSWQSCVDRICKQQAMMAPEKFFG
ncbi:MAG TPA: tetraacyldisaccharide 4'-kinase [Chthoniobacteraceae bacterium]|jgi:tetraacyldisaccharide 4'-kinase|nr:tetraacyldisaccharide 4'-kinase [Chthoniobacteraceae bacterium]